MSDTEEEGDHEIEYNPEFEQLLKENGDHAQVYSILHQSAHIKYKKMFDALNIPLIVMTATIGFVTGIGLSYPYTGVVLGALSVFVSFMKSIISYMKLSERSENHRICSLQFSQISNEIKIELSLRRNQRQPAKILLDVIKVKFKNLMEVAQLIDDDIIEQFREKYLGHGNNVKISLPPVFEDIPGIKIMGGDTNQEYLRKLSDNFERYQKEKSFELESMKFDYQHQKAVRILKETYQSKRYHSDGDVSDSSSPRHRHRRPRTQRQSSMDPRAESSVMIAIPNEVVPKDSMIPKDSVVPKDSMIPKDSVVPKDSMIPKDSVVPNDSVVPKDSMINTAVIPVREPVKRRSTSERVRMFAAITRMDKKKETVLPPLTIDDVD